MKHIDIFTTPYVINIAMSVKNMLDKLNYKTTINMRQITNEDIQTLDESDNSLMFLFCVQWLYRPGLKPLPTNKYIIYQLEQLDRKIDNAHLHNDFLNMLYNNAYHIFDYSKLNLKYLSNYKNKLSTLMPPVVEHNNEAFDKIYDVLFVGGINEKRQNILINLRYAGINVHVVSKVFGDDLKKLIKQSKIFLNIRFSDSSILETCRLNEAFLVKDTYIISELPKNNLDDINFYKKRVIFIEPDNINTLIKTINITLRLYNLRKPDIILPDTINDISFKNLNTILPFVL